MLKNKEAWAYIVHPGVIKEMHVFRFLENEIAARHLSKGYGQWYTIWSSDGILLPTTTFKLKSKAYVSNELVNELLHRPLL